MANEKVLELLKDEGFLKELGTAGTPEDAQKLFESKGGEVTIEELQALRAIVKQKSGEKLDADELDLVAGGSAVDNIIEASALWLAANSAILLLAPILVSW